MPYTSYKQVQQSQPQPNLAFHRFLLWSGFNGLFAGLLLGVLLGQAESSRVSFGAYIAFISAALLCVTSFLLIFDRQRDVRLSGGLQLWVAISGAVILSMVIQGILNNRQGPLDDFLLDTLPWLCLVFLPVLGHPIFWEDLKRILKMHAVMGVIVNLLLVIPLWAAVTEAEATRQEALAIKSGQILLYSIPYLVLLFGDLKPFMRSVAAVGLLQLAIFGIVSQTRQSIILLWLLLLLAIWAHWRRQTVSPQRKSTRLFLTNMLILIGMYIVLLSIGDALTRSIELTRFRFELSSGASSLEENVRWDEIEMLFQQLNPLEIMLGRGVQGTFHSPLGLDYYVHIGYFYAVLKGGFFLLFLILFGIIGVSTRVLLSSRDPAVLAAAGLCGWFGAKLAMGNILDTNPNFYLVLVCFGLCVYWLAEGQFGAPLISSRFSPISQRDLGAKL